MKRITILFTLLLVLLVACIPDNAAATESPSLAEALLANEGEPDCTGLGVGVVGTADGGVAVFCTPFPTLTATATVAPTATIEPTPTVTGTATPTPTATNSPTATSTNEPTVTPTIHTHPTDEPTATATAGPTAAATVAPSVGQLCPTWVHDLHVTTGPDGNTYPTWHPQVDPTYGCYFGHDHGADPHTSTVNPTLPPFGYINAVSRAGGNAHPVEAHAGFKVFTYECGQPGDQGPNQIAARVVIHMGTSGVARYTVPHHSVHYSGRACDGSWSLDVQGMVDFPGIGSICGPRMGRDFATIGCVEEGKPETAYEIWTGALQIKYPGEFEGLWQARAYIQVSPAVFDPVLAVDPADLTRIVYTTDLVYPGQYDPLSPNSPFRGCKMEAYQGPVSLNNRNRPTTYITDAFGNVLLDAAAGDPGTLIQYVSAHRVNGTASNASANGQQFKSLFDMCSSVVRAPN